ncbi:GtrA family protein [Mycetocola reblochoni]|uniref:GtrA family protein n=1 Tax=Mycetocola reblochoni TaxID=331618 RepID=A0A3L6ZS70_9MICO|nr:GtrA family protein [Mycetocola reblochoni]
MRHLSASLAKFLVVGGVGFVVDVTLFNLLRLGVFGTDVPWQSPLGAKTISVSVAIVLNWLGNRSWTFRRGRAGGGPGRMTVGTEFVQVVLVSLGGMAITLGCLWVSHYVLGFTSIVADNIASNVVGLGLGTAFRFALLRTWVYRDRTPTEDRGRAAARPTGPGSVLTPTAPATGGVATLTGEDRHA